jgi:hypothetical protein
MAAAMAIDTTMLARMTRRRPVELLIARRPYPRGQAVMAMSAWVAQ